MLNVNINKVHLINPEKIILRDINFTLEPDCIYTILGKNGSGKSTLLKSLTRLLDERFYSVDGSVQLNGKNLFTISESELLEIRRNKIKYIFQDPVKSFDHLKTFEYYIKTSLSFISRRYRLRERKKLSEVNNNNEIEDLLKYFLLPDSKTLFKMFPYEVSGGMAQRISLVLALLSNPKFILLDEPTSGIDAPITNLVLLKLREFIKEKDKAVLLVTQNLDFAKSASDKISLLSKGTLTPFKETKDYFSEQSFGKEHLFEI